MASQNEGEMMQGVHISGDDDIGGGIGIYVQMADMFKSGNISSPPV